MKQASCVLLGILYLLYSGECETSSLLEMGRALLRYGVEELYSDNLKDIQGFAAPIDLDKEIIFMLYTRKNPTHYTTLKPKKGASVGHFNSKRKTKFIIHGWMSAGEYMENVTTAYLKAYDYNVIVVDWTDIANTLYHKAKATVGVIGEYVASLFDFLATHHGLRPVDVHIVGHSLGAHIAGVAGNRTKTGKPGRITALDPASPLINKQELQNIIDRTDGQFVDVVHTCIRWLGWKDPIGHADFYPNGDAQPGCFPDVAGYCSHSRAHKYFAESITTTSGFVSYKCGSWKDYKKGKCFKNPKTLMGERVNNSSSGTYYLKTANQPPFALGDNKTLVER